MLKGADFSKYQGSINWDTVKSSMDFAIVKATEGDPDPGQTVQAYEDPNFKTNQAEMRRVDILRGFYHFARPDFNEPEGEAQEFFNAVGGFQDGEVAFLDFETFTIKDGLSPVEWALRWLNEFERLSGNKAVIYMSSSRTTEYDWTPVVQAGHGLWVANYGVNNGTVGNGNFATGAWAAAAFWQYTSEGNEAGKNPLDLDNFYGDLNAFKAYGYHSNATAPTQPSEPPVVSKPPVSEPKPPIEVPPVTPTPQPVPTTEPPTVVTPPITNQPPVIVTPPADTSHPTLVSWLNQILKEIINIIEGK